MEKQVKGNHALRFCHPLPLFIATPLLLLLISCATPSDKSKPPTVSLEEAKKITATFEGQDFTPPPRTINDITKILSQEKPEDLEFFNKALQRADSPPPDTRDALTLAKFYLDRGHAAFEVGRAKQEIEDLRLAFEYGEKSGFRCLNRAMLGLSTAEGRGGNFSRGIEIMKKLLSKVDRASQVAGYNALIAFFYVNVGDIEAAYQALSRADNAASDTLRWNPGPWRNAMKSLVSEGRATSLDAMGRLSEGEVEHRKALAEWEPLKDAVWECETPKNNPKVYNWLFCELGENLRLQGRLVEAEIEARKAVIGALKSHGRYSAHTAFVLRGLCEVIFEQGRYAESEVLARADIEIHRRAGTARESFPLAKARAVLADAIFAQSRWGDALKTYDGILEDLKGDRASYEEFIATKVNLWLALIKGGRGSEALGHVRPAYERERGRLGETHYKTAEIRGVLGMALAATGDKEAALWEFSKAVPILIRGSGGSEGGKETGTARGFRLGLILDAYIRLLSEVRGTPLEARAGIDAAAEAFRLADAARGRTVKRALAASSARAAARDPVLADLGRKEQDALTQAEALDAILSNVLSAPGGQQDPAIVRDLRSRIDQLAAARTALLKEIAARFPDYADLIDPKPVTIEQARANLRPGEALIATYVGEGGTCVWAIPHSGPPAFASIGLDEKAIAHMVSVLRVSLDPQGGTLGSIPAFDLGTAFELYKTLLQPVEAGWKSAKNLLLVAHGALGFLPFSVLPVKQTVPGEEREPLFSNYRDVPWLARTHSVTVLPSVASLRTLRNLPAPDPGRQAFKGFGDPFFRLAQAQNAGRETDIRPATPGITRGMPVKRRGLTTKTAQQKEPDSAGIGSLPPLPDTAEEVRGIARALRADLEKDVFLGKAASEESVKSADLSKVKVLVFATHGLLPGELDGLTQPALALSAPEVTGGEEDGLLTMGEILGLRLNADWVVLSACNTGAGQGAGAEAVSGMGRAFFYAGTRALLVSNWPVETTSAKTLTTELFRRQAGDPNLSRADALKGTMLDLIDRGGYVDKEGRMVFSYAHPVFWAPFSLVGDGG
ncbi:MAG: CHAT domain-containing protein [Pseudomonadota bacterium]